MIKTAPPKIIDMINLFKINSDSLIYPNKDKMNDTDIVNVIRVPILEPVDVFSSSEGESVG